ncbi:hypothetical protein Tco_0950728 [Tanacetum coccineum]
MDSPYALVPIVNMIHPFNTRSGGLNDLNFATLNTDGQSTKVEAPPPITHVDDDNDFIDDKDDVPHDLTDSGIEVLANFDDDDEVVIMAVEVACGHGGDGVGDSPLPPHRIGSGCQQEEEAGEAIEVGMEFIKARNSS